MKQVDAKSLPSARAIVPFSQLELLQKWSSSPGNGEKNVEI